MPASTNWQPLEGTLESMIERAPKPIDLIASADVPAIVLRRAFDPIECERLVRRLIDRELLFDARSPVPESFRQAGVPEGYFVKGSGSAEAREARERAANENRTRIDIGSSLGYRGAEREGFFAHSEESLALFEDLFDGFENPIELIYRTLSALAGGTPAVIAHEADGRRYGPAIIRAHYGSYTYKPHFDSVRLREKRDDYAVSRFEHQFAGVLVLQNAERDGASAQCTLHRCLWEPEVDRHLRDDIFDEFARERGIESCRVELEPGDLYFFNTRLIHEVPGLDGEEPRIVLATFIGYSESEPEIFVWS